MSYTRTNWDETVAITAGRLNNIEQGIVDEDSGLTLHMSKNASTTDYGHVKIGSGLDVTDGVISVQSISLNNNITLYVDATNGNDTNTGVDASHAFKTVQGAIDYANTNGKLVYQIQFNIASGTYTVPTNESLQKLQATIISFCSTGTTANTFFSGMFDIGNIKGKLIRIVHFTISGDPNYGILGNQWSADLDVYYCAITAAMYAIKICQANFVSISGCTLNSSTLLPVDCENVGTVSISGSTTFTGGMGIIELVNVGSADIESITCVIPSPATSSPAIDIRCGTTAYCKSIKGTLGTSPIFRVHGGIIIKDSITATGGADVKENGGQIFA